MKRKVEKSVLNQLRQRGGRWAVYENMDLGSAGLGHRQYIKYGPGCTLKHAPAHAPDTEHGLGWRYQHIGFVELVSGNILDQEPDPVN